MHTQGTALRFNNAEALPMIKREIPDAETISEWCESNRIGRSFYYKLKKEGRAPREIRIGAKVLISREASADWRRAMEQAAA